MRGKTVITNCTDSVTFKKLVKEEHLEAEFLRVMERVSLESGADRLPESFYKGEFSAK